MLILIVYTIRQRYMDIVIQFVLYYVMYRAAFKHVARGPQFVHPWLHQRILGVFCTNNLLTVLLRYWLKF